MPIRSPLPGWLRGHGIKLPESSRGTFEATQAQKSPCRRCPLGGRSCAAAWSTWSSASSHTLILSGATRTRAPRASAVSRTSPLRATGRGIGSRYECSAVQGRRRILPVARPSSGSVTNARPNSPASRSSPLEPACRTSTTTSRYLRVRLRDSQAVVIAPTRQFARRWKAVAGSQGQASS